MKPPSRPRTFIRQWREYRGMTLAHLEKETGLTNSHLSMLERGLRGYTQDSLELIAAALQTDAAALLTLDPSNPEAVWAWLAKFGQAKRKPSEK